MDYKVMDNTRLLEALAGLAVSANETNLDLIDSGKRFRGPISEVAEIVLGRMHGGTDGSNKAMLAEFVDAAVNAALDDDHPIEACNDCMRTILHNMADATEELREASATSGT